MKTELVLLGRRYNVASRARRRKVVIAFYAVFLALLVASWTKGGVSSGGWFTIEFTVLIGPILGGYLSKTLFCSEGIVEPFGAKDNDERALSRRDGVHYAAYRYLTIVAGTAFLVEFNRYSSLLRYFRVVGIGPGQMERITYDLLQITYILSLTLPPAILLWTEPDIEGAD